MRKATLLAVILLTAAAGAFAVPADITYTDGDTTLKLKSGATQDAQIGDKLNTGDTLRTGKDGQAELDQGGVTIKIASGTVFTLMEREAGGKTQTVLSMALGSIKYKYGKISGSEPAVRTNGAVAGVRGTEFTVFSGADGSTLFAVDTGQVTVEAEGKSVDLAANQGVEVPLGQPPGDIIPLQSNQIDYSKWNEDKFVSMLADPLAAMTNVEAAMDGYIKAVQENSDGYDKSSQQLAAEREKVKQVAEQQGKDAASKYEQEVALPLSLTTGHYFLNMRYNALAALSLRRFVAGRLYLFMKARSLAGAGSEEWTAFIARYNDLLGKFETSIVPHLVPVDI
jgi:hypothetical protein